MHRKQGTTTGRGNETRVSDGPKGMNDPTLLTSWNHSSRLLYLGLGVHLFAYSVPWSGVHFTLPLAPASWGI